MRRAYVWGCLLVFAAVAGAGAGVPIHAWLRRGPPPASSVADEVRQLRAELEQIRQESATARRLSYAAARAVPALAQQATEAQAASPANHVEAPPPAPTNDDYFAYVETEFANAPVDAKWDPARELGMKLRQVMPPGSAVTSLACRASMCRLETSHRDLDSYRAFTNGFLPTAGSEPLWAGPAAFRISSEPSEGRDIVAVAFLGRESLPVLARE